MIALNKYLNFLLLLVSFGFSQILISQSEVKTMALMKNPYMKMENIQGYEFDEANQCMLLFQVFNVNKTSLIQEKTEPCNSILETLHPKQVTSGKQNVLYKRIMASIQGLAKGEVKKELPTFLLAIYSFPISENKEELGNIVALEAYTTDISYNNNRKLVFDDGCIDIVSVSYLDEKYPNLSIGKVKSTLTFKSKGSGITAKNSKLYTEINTLKRKAGDAEFIVTKPNYDENISKFANYFTDSKHIVHDPVSGKYAGIAHKQIEDDNFYLYKNFSVIWSDKEGKIINHLDFSKQYLKKVNQFIPVYDEFTNVKGVFLNLNHQPSFKKAYKDPVENNFHVLYSDFDGNVMLNKDIQYGNPENSRCFNPMVAIKTDGKLKFLNRNQDKLLNSFLEVVELDFNGEIKSLGEVKSVNIDIFHIEEFNFRRIGDKNIIISSVARMESATPTSTTTQVATLPRYSDLVINVFDMTKMQIVSSQSHKMDFNEIKDLKVIDDSNGQLVFIVPTDVTQTLVSIDKGNVIKIENPLFNPRSKSYAPLDPQISVFDNANYIVDKKQRTIHFVKSSNQNASHTFFYFSHKY